MFLEFAAKFAVWRRAAKNAQTRNRRQMRGAQTKASDQRERLPQFRAAARIGTRAVAGGSDLFKFRAAARTGTRAAAGAVAGGILGRLSGLRGVDEIAFGGILSRNERRSVADSINQTCSGVAGSVP